MSHNGNLPQDIITDILSRLPVKSLFRFMCVSPLWKSLISDPRFAKTHLNRTRTKNPNYPALKIVNVSDCGDLKSVDYNDVNLTPTKLEFPTVVEQVQQVAEKWVQVLNSCDGLLLVSRTDASLNYKVARTDKSIFLLNPSTRECMKLPVCPFFQNSILVDSNPYGVFYDSSADDYKVLMPNYCPNNGSFIALSMPGYITILSVYSLKTNVWTRIEVPQGQFSGQNKHRLNGYPVGTSGGVLLNGCLHYFWWNITGRYMTIMAFDLSGDEIFREMPLPVSASFNRSNRLVVLGGALCLVHALGREVWMMKEYGATESWTKFTMYSALCIQDVVCMLAEDEFLSFETNGKRQLVVYNPLKFTERVICGNPTSLRFGGTYVESLVSPFHEEEIERQIYDG